MNNPTGAENAQVELLEDSEEFDLKAREIAIEQRFWDKIFPEPNSGCWLWTASVNDEGYGRFFANGKTFLAHRWSYEWFCEPIPIGLVIDHLCRVRCCANPNHLEVVTYHENYMRGLGLKGERNGRAKLTKKDICVIRNLHSVGQSKNSIGQQFNVNEKTIRRIINGKSWAHISQEKTIEWDAKEAENG